MAGDVRNISENKALILAVSQHICAVEILEFVTSGWRDIYVDFFMLMILNRDFSGYN